MAILNNTGYRLIEQGLDATWMQQKIISQNIANADTPGYKAKTVSFKAVIEEKNEKMKSHIEQQNQINLKTIVTEEDGTNQIFDGNNIDAEKEMVSFADAQIRYDTLIQKMNSEFSMIRTALSR